MARKRKKLKIGEQVIAVFLGSKIQCEVVEISPMGYKLITPKGRYLPNANWLSSEDKKKVPWHIVSLCTERISMDIVGKSSVSQRDTVTGSNDATELKSAVDKHIIKQKKFLEHKLKK